MKENQTLKEGIAQLKGQIQTDNSACSMCRVYLNKINDLEELMGRFKAETRLKIQ